jgi:hypothetical protein
MLCLSRKEFGLTAPTRILEEARSQNLETVVVVSQRSTGEMIRQFEDNDESEEELRRKIPHRIHTEMDTRQIQR